MLSEAIPSLNVVPFDDCVDVPLLLDVLVKVNSLPGILSPKSGTRVAFSSLFPDVSSKIGGVVWSSFRSAVWVPFSFELEDDGTPSVGGSMLGV